MAHADAAAAATAAVEQYLYLSEKAAHHFASLRYARREPSRLRCGDVNLMLALGCWTRQGRGQEPAAVRPAPAVAAAVPADV